MVEEVEAEMAEAGERAAEEKLAAPVVFERVDMGGEGDSGREGREGEDNSESQSGGVAGVEENQPVEEEQQPQQEGPQQQEEGSQQQVEVTEEDAHREQLVEGGTEVNEQERPQGETGPEREELPTHAADRDNNGDRHEQQQQQQQEEEAVDHPIQKLEEEVPTETHELQSGGEGVDQQQHPEQQETVNAGGDTLDSQQLQQKHESEDGGTSGNEFHSGQELKDLEGDENQMQQTVEGEAGVIEGQEQTQRQMERGGGEDVNEKYGGDPIQDIEERSKATVEESRQQSADENLTDEPHVGDSLTYGAHPEVLPDAPDRKTPWSTQADQSQNAKEKLKASDSQMVGGSVGGNGDISGHQWKLCNATAGQDYIPCLDNEEALRHLHSTRHFEHRERHCPEEAPTCLVPLPKGYRQPIEWPKSRDRVRR